MFDIGKYAVLIFLIFVSLFFCGGGVLYELSL
jgi:hypothetical protein